MSYFFLFNITALKGEWKNYFFVDKLVKRFFVDS